MWLVTSLCIIVLHLLFESGSIQGCELNHDPNTRNSEWYKNAIIYQIYPRSFMDSNGDGVGDLNGIIDRMDHLKDIGVTALWMSPIYKSPQKDFGYDISDFSDVSPEFGTLQDFDNLVAKAKRLGLKVMMDLVPNHSSDEHSWFQKSIKRIKPYDEYFIWKNASYDRYGNRNPPNNWISAFGYSAWEWNSERNQYYYHAFAPGQPDLNYRNPRVRQEMEDVITFWMDRGVDGFRVDAVQHMFEDENLTNNPLSGKNVPDYDFDYHIPKYTRDLFETYDVVASWIQLLDRYTLTHRTDKKIMLMEAYTTISNSMGYYRAGADPFNFMFIADLGSSSSALDFKRKIDQWTNAIPEGHQPNWVNGNHDNHRVASRYGVDRADQLTMLGTVLPGILVVYNGDEIGMVDREFTYEETLDTAGCQAGPDRYMFKSRDPERTPFQWDATTSAGFSTSTRTWLPVNSNYRTLNLAAEKLATVSHLSVFKALSKLKKHPFLKEAESEVMLATADVLAVIRKMKNQDPLVLLVNFSDNYINIDAQGWLNIPEDMVIYVASARSNLANGRAVNTTSLQLPGAASVILANSTFVFELTLM